MKHTRPFAMGITFNGRDILFDPKLNTDCTDPDVTIQGMYFETMPDGTTIEFCLWSEADMVVLDVSAPKEDVPFTSDTGFREYLVDNGLAADNDIWYYQLEIIKTDNAWRVQFVSLDQ